MIPCAVVALAFAWISGTLGCGPRQDTPTVGSTQSSSSADAATPATAKQETSQQKQNAAGTTAGAGHGWGHLRGTFVFDAPAPERKELQVTSDQQYCGPLHPLDESLIVNPENSGLANVIVSLYLARGESPPAAHPDYEATADAKISLDNLQCRFAPHVLVLRTTQTLLVLNSDAIAHNTKIDTLDNPPVNPTLPAGESLEFQFSEPERRAARVSCSIHPWMSAWVLVNNHPYAAVTDVDGKFEIRNLPTGEWTIQAWHETGFFLTEVTQDGQETQWNRGRFTVAIADGATTDVGEIRVRADLFGDR